jgi:2-polyprenyl-6-hydroxyphenyl methylase/3-demethylubiquinone-9 3-methyltransferase
VPVQLKTYDKATMSNVNVDTTEIAKFNKIANEWWDCDGKFKTLHDINAIRLQFIQEHTLLKQQAALDVGCGGGILSESLALLGNEVTALDMDEAALDVAREHQKQSNLTIDYNLITIEEFAANHPASFPLVTCMEMLEHVPDPSSVIQACSKAAAPGGDVFFSTINRTPKAYLLAILGAEYLLQLLPRGTHDYMKFIQPSELAQWARLADLEVKTIVGMGYNPVTRIAYFTDKPSVNYLVHCRKLGY